MGKREQARIEAAFMRGDTGVDGVATEELTADRVRGLVDQQLLDAIVVERRGRRGGGDVLVGDDPPDDEAAVGEGRREQPERQQCRTDESARRQNG